MDPLHVRFWFGDRANVLLGMVTISSNIPRALALLGAT